MRLLSLALVPLKARPRHAFTLLELLVVIVIIGILAALLLATVTRAKQRSQETICLNNLRQIEVGLKLYQGDHQNRLPLLRTIKEFPGTVAAPGATNGDGLWDLGPALGGKDPASSKAYPPAKDRPLFPFVKNPEVFHCPADKGGLDTARNISMLPSYWAVIGCSYYYNALDRRPGADIAAPGIANKSEDRVQESSRFVLVYESPLRSRGQEPMILWHRAESSESLLLSQHYEKGRKLVTPFLFLDGHAQFLVFRKGETPWTSPRLLWEHSAL